VRVVVLDAMGVLYSAADDVTEWLIPFTRRLGCALSAEQITTAYVSCSLGAFSSKALWQTLGVWQEGSDLDTAYIEAYTLMPGALELLARLRAAGVLVACVCNDVREWSLAARRALGLEEYITHWIVSGEVGARKPDPRIYRHLLEASGALPHECVVVDDQARNLNAARKLGFTTLWYTQTTALSPETHHQAVSDFGDLTAWLMGSGVL